MNSLYNVFSSQERIIVFDPDKSKLQITIDAKSLLYPTDPARFHTEDKNDRDHEDKENHTRQTGDAASRQIKNQAKDVPLKCRDKSLKNSAHGYTYPYTGQCANHIDKLALAINKIELIQSEEENETQDDEDQGESENNESAINDDEEEDYKQNYTVVATVYEDAHGLPLHINSSGLLVVEALMNPVIFNGLKITFGDGNGLVYRNRDQRTIKSVRLKNLEKPAVTNEIELKAAWVTAIQLALDDVKLTFDKTEAQNSLKGRLKYRNIQNYEGAWAYVTSYDNPDGGLEAPGVALPLNVDQTEAELNRQLALMPGRTFIAEDTANPKMYHAMIYIDNPKHKSILKVMGIMNDFFPLFGNNTWTTQPGGIIDTANHQKGFFVYALISDFQYNLLLAFKLFRAFDVIEQVSYETLAYAGYHMGQPVAEPTELEFTEAEEAFQVAINSGVVTFPTAATAIGTLNVNMRYNFWSSLQNFGASITRAIIDVVRVVINAVIQTVTQIARVVGIIFNPSGAVKGIIGFKDKNGSAYMKRGYHFYLPGSTITIRQTDFELNGTEVNSGSDGYFNSGPLASETFGKTLKYRIRIVLDNPAARVFNANPYWPVVVDLKTNTSSNIAEFEANDVFHEILPFQDPRLFVYGVVNFAAKRSKELFNFQPDQAIVIVGGAADLVATHGAMAPSGHLSSVINTLLNTLTTGIPFPFFDNPLTMLAHLGGLQLDGDLYIAKHPMDVNDTNWIDNTWIEKTIVHEYGHYVLTNKIDQKFLTSPIDGLLENYLIGYHDNPKSIDGHTIDDFAESNAPAHLGFYGDRMNLVRLWEAWAEFFAFNALTTKTGSLYDVPEVGNRLNGYVIFPTSDIDGINGLELNMGSPSTYFSNGIKFELSRDTVGRDVSILQDLADDNADIDASSGKTDTISLGFQNVFEAMADYAPSICMLDVLQIDTATPPCNFNMRGFYSYLQGGSLFAQNGIISQQLMDLYQIHGIIFENNSPIGNMISYNASTDTFDLQVTNFPTGSEILAASQTSIMWQSGVIGNYSVKINGNCINGSTSNGSNGYGNVFVGEQVTSEILQTDLIEGLNTIRICVQSGGTMEDLTFQIMNDNTAPVVSANPAGGAYLGTQNVTITCTDANGSGCNQILYTKDQTTPRAGSPSTFIVSGNAAYTTVSCNQTLTFLATDKAGHISPMIAETYTNGTSCCTTGQLCVDQTVCGNTTISVENTECWNDFFDKHYCICGSQAIWPWSEKKCYVNISVPYCTTQPACTPQTVCNY